MIIDYITTGLKVASLIRLGRLTSLESSAINARLGNISPERLTRIKNLLINWLRKSNECGLLGFAALRERSAFGNAVILLIKL